LLQIRFRSGDLSAASLHSTSPLQTLIIYTKPNCSLCDEALEEVEAARQLIPFQLEQVDILNNLALYEKYKHDIPVLCLNGEEIFRHRVLREELMEKLQQCDHP
jgi:glutaredoxin